MLDPSLSEHSGRRSPMTSLVTWGSLPFHIVIVMAKIRVGLAREVWNKRYPRLNSNRSIANLCCRPRSDPASDGVGDGERFPSALSSVDLLRGDQLSDATKRRLVDRDSTIDAVVSVAIGLDECQQPQLGQVDVLVVGDTRDVEDESVFARRVAAAAAAGDV